MSYRLNRLPDDVKIDHVRDEAQTARGSATPLAFYTERQEYAPCYSPRDIALFGALRPIYQRTFTHGRRKATIAARIPQIFSNFSSRPVERFRRDSGCLLLPKFSRWPASRCSERSQSLDKHWVISHDITFSSFRVLENLWKSSSGSCS